MISRKESLALPYLIEEKAATFDTEKKGKKSYNNIREN